MARYTAQEMRNAANRFAFEEDSSRSDTIVAMLRQAADAMEREEKIEKKYEYKVLYRRDGCLWEAVRHSENIQSAMEILGIYSGYKDAHIVRREVGEWE